jgi:hypothetical protein
MEAETGDDFAVIVNVPVSFLQHSGSYGRWTDVVLYDHAAESWLLAFLTVGREEQMPILGVPDSRRL